MKYSLGIGLTNNCNLLCPHCYRNKDKISNVSLKDIKTLFRYFPINSVGMGTGENILNPEFDEILEYLSKQDIKLSIASNGLTLTSLCEEKLAFFNDVEVSVDFPTERGQDSFRGSGNWSLIHQAIERCKDLGINMSLLATMMSINYQYMKDLVSLARSFDLNLRVAVYQAVFSDSYRLSYDQFWQGFKDLLSTGELISCSEPVVRAALGLNPVYSPCGHKSIRINPLGQISPCVYYNGTHTTHSLHTINDLSDLGEDILNTYYFMLSREIPSEAKDCPCQGGCFSRRALDGNLNAHDFYCPWARGEEMKLEYHQAVETDLVRSENNCNIIVK
ncbi:MAG: hypothetical protein BAJALOKI1v1_340004 [Promethearchaeota archaeon]|nr:MAG: hypothetical protein BAJALOKI1v1_340004 [Candidatus Lokiarchaeota archaeon]